MAAFAQGLSVLDGDDIGVDEKAAGRHLVDDLIATGGTAAAAVSLLRRGGANVVGASFVVDLPELGGAKKIEDLGVPVSALVAFDGH